MFPSLFNDLPALSGLAAQYPKSRLLGRADRTWAHPLEAAAVELAPRAPTSLSGATSSSGSATSMSDFFYTTRKWIRAAELKRQVTRFGIGLRSSTYIWAANPPRRSIVCKCPVPDPS